MRREAQHVLEKRGVHRVVHADKDVLLHRHLAEEADVLERTGDAEAVDLDRVHAGGIDTVQKDRAAGRLVDLREEVEDRRLAGAVRADDAGNLGRAHCDVEVVDCREAAEVDAEVLDLEDERLSEVALGDQVGRRYRKQHLALTLALDLIRAIGHLSPPPSSLLLLLLPSSASSRGTGRS